MVQRATFKSFQESTKEEWANIMVALQDTQSMVADRVIDNSGDEDALRSAVNDVWSWMSGLRERGARP